MGLTMLATAVCGSDSGQAEGGLQPADLLPVMPHRPAARKRSKRKHAEDEDAGAEEDGSGDSREVVLQVQVAELQVRGLPGGRQLHIVQDPD